MNNKSLTVITPADLQTAQGVYEQSKGWLAAYETKHAKLAEQVKAAGEKLPAALDAACNQFQVSARAALKAMNEKRSPFTEKAHAFVKLFTDMENRVKAMDAEIQAHRNASATIYAREEAARREAERIELATKQERITLLANAEQQVRDAYSALLQADKDELLAAFEGASIEQIGDVETVLAGIAPKLTPERWAEMGSSVRLAPTSLTPADATADIIRQALGGDKYDKCAPHYASEITGYAKTLLAMVPQRRAELEQGVEESKAAEELRRKQEQLAADQARAAKEAAERAAEQEKAKAVLNQQVAQANRQIEAPKAVESYKITVASRAGWVEVFKFYLANTDEVAGEDLGKVKLDSMRLLAERLAKSTGELIDHPDVVYEAKYKAAVRRKKEAA